MTQIVGVDGRGRTLYQDEDGGVPYIILAEDGGDAGSFLGCGECGKPVKGRGLCMAHYQAARRGGYLEDYPREEVYDASWVETVIRQAIQVHGREIVEGWVEDGAAWVP